MRASGIEDFLPFESPSFHVLAGSANFLFPAMMGGSLGGTVSLANSFPRLVLDLFAAGQARDEATGVPLQARVTRINQAISGTHGVAGVKAAMDLAGFVGGIPRRPLLPLAAPEVEALRVLLARRGAALVTRDILAVDVGTSALKLGVFGPDLEKRCETQRAYEPHLYDRGKADIEPETWWQALREGCAEVQRSLGEVGVVSLSVTTPGLTPMAADGTALGPAILFLDGRSRAQSAAIRRIVGEERFLAETCNLPVSGGSSLSSILWFRDERPEVWAEAAKFGHCNTYLVKRMTGRWAIDPSTVSISGLYNTARNDLTWNDDILRLAGIPEDKLPPLLQSYDPVGQILPAVADELGLPRDCTVLCGGNDAVLAALSGGLAEPGDINIISGTCDIASVCTDAPVASPDFNVRCHVIPGRWLTFFVLNTGGAALDWFHASFCRELSDGQFYDEYVPGVLDGVPRGSGRRRTGGRATDI